MAKKTIFIIVLLLGLGFMIHNLYYYPVNAGYDAGLHINYTKIISYQWRFPDLLETREGYNPPFFYILSGLVTRLSSFVTGNDFLTALKNWQYLSIIFSSAILFFWWQIIKSLQPKNKLFQSVFLILLFSLPVFHKTIVMYNLELFSAFTITIAFWYFILHFQLKPDLKKTIILALLTNIALLTRMSAMVLLPTFIIGFIGLKLTKIINWQQTIKFLTVFLMIVFIGTSWFYLGRRNQDIYGVGEGVLSDKPFFQRQSLVFYTEIPFKLMMSYPIRFSKHTPLNRLIPIYYSEFWGDWWNYYSQRRFNITVQARKKDHYITTEERVKNLALQNRINFLPTLLIITGFGYLIVKVIKKTFKKPGEKWLTEVLFVSLTVFTLLGWLYMITEYPTWKGDSIKASYMLSILPVFIYGLVLFLFKKVKPKKIIFIPTIIYLGLSTIINLIWNWY